MLFAEKTIHVPSPSLTPARSGSVKFKIQNAKIKMTSQNPKLINSFCILDCHLPAGRFYILIFDFKRVFAPHQYRLLPRLWGYLRWTQNSSWPLVLCQFLALSLRDFWKFPKQLFLLPWGQAECCQR